MPRDVQIGQPVVTRAAPRPPRAGPDHLPHPRGAPRVSGLAGCPHARVGPGGVWRGGVEGHVPVDARGHHAAVSTARGPRSDMACATRTGAASRRPPRPPAAGGAGPRRSTGAAAGLVGGARRAWCSGDSVRGRGRQIRGPSLVVASGVYHEGRTQHDPRVRARVGRTAVPPVAGAARGAVIVVDHRRQAAAVAAAQTAAVVAAAAADARPSRPGLDAAVADVVACVRERDPGLTQHEALDRVIDAWRARAADRADPLTGRPRYRAVSTLGGVGAAGTAGPGLREQRPLRRALAGTWDDRDASRSGRGDHTARATVSAAAERPPSCPVPHDARAACAVRAGDDAWRPHVDRALEILSHPTRIAGQHRPHAEGSHGVRRRREQPPGR